MGEEVMSSQLFGFLNVYKPLGMTSHDVVGILRKVTKVKQIGHSGTLDPFAQGVLPVAIGKATRLIEYLDGEKEYLATVQFGKSTDTYDCEGSETFSSDKKVSQSQIVGALKNFEGEIEQFPPIYSAIKVNGKKLYEYARAGESVKIEPRRVCIEKIEMKGFDEKSQTAEIIIRCSKGTYIRSIAHDLGQMLKVGAHLSKLIRTQAGKFIVADCVFLDDLKLVAEVQEKFLNPLDYLDFVTYNVSEAEQKLVLTGQAIKYIGEFSQGQTIILVYNNKILSVSQIEGEYIKIKKVFS